MVAFYLRYRPQSLDDLIGQDSVKKTLIGAFRENKLSHAYLLVGPRGTGKTSTARIIAKMVNCEGKGESGKGEVPCNKCDSCISITDGSNMDLIEIDAASNRGIEDIRDLRQNDPNAHEIERYIEAKEAREDAATESAYDAGLLFALLTISRGAHQIYRRAMNVPERKMNGGYHHG